MTYRTRQPQPLNSFNSFVGENAEIIMKALFPLSTDDFDSEEHENALHVFSLQYLKMRPEKPVVSLLDYRFRKLRATKEKLREGWHIRVYFQPLWERHPLTSETHQLIGRPYMSRNCHPSMQIRSKAHSAKTYYSDNWGNGGRHYLGDLGCHSDKSMDSRCIAARLYRFSGELDTALRLVATENEYVQYLFFTGKTDSMETFEEFFRYVDRALWDDKMCHASYYDDGDRYDDMRDEEPAFEEERRWDDCISPISSV